MRRRCYFFLRNLIDFIKDCIVNNLTSIIIFSILAVIFIIIGGFIGFRAENTENYLDLVLRIKNENFSIFLKFFITSLIYIGLILLMYLTLIDGKFIIINLIILLILSYRLGYTIVLTLIVGNIISFLMLFLVIIPCELFCLFVNIILISICFRNAYSSNCFCYKVFLNKNICYAILFILFFNFIFYLILGTILNIFI
jgi:hypothetical protein